MRNQCLALSSAILILTARADAQPGSGRGGNDPHELEQVLERAAGEMGASANAQDEGRQGTAVAAPGPKVGRDRMVDRTEIRDACSSGLTVHIAVPASPAEDERVAVLRAEVERIWRRYDIAFDWSIPQEPGSPSTGPDLWVVTANGPLASRDHRRALAALFFAGETPTNQIRLASPSSIIDALGEIRHALVAAPRGGRVQQRLIGRVLGRALAHEVGHYLLASKRHDASGLMRAQVSLFEKAELDNRRGFALDASSLAALRAQRPAPCASLVAGRRTKG